MIRRGFTLVEVLISVLILALAVLGLAAVFTATIPQQRVATDQAMGLGAVDSAKAALLGDKQFADPYNEFQFRQERGLRLWQSQTDDFSPEGEWELPDPSNSLFEMAVERTAVDAGDLLIDSPTGGTDMDTRIPLRRRLIPAPYTNASEPQYVWDFIARRVLSVDLDGDGDLDATDEDAMEIALIVRRIDPGIRVARRERRGTDPAQFGRWIRLSDLLVRPAGETLGESELVVPVAASTAQSIEPGVGVATNDGRGDYALPFFVGVEGITTAYRGGRAGDSGPGGPSIGNSIPRDRIPLIGSVGGGGDADLRARMASRIGQSLIDRRGNVYGVVGIDEERSGGGTTWVIVDPPVPADYGSPQDLKFQSAGEDLVATPQPPVAVRVFRVNPS